MKRLIRTRMLALLLGGAMTCCLIQSAVAAPLSLTLDQVTDISGLGFGGVGGLAYNPLTDDLWISDAAGSLSSPGPGQTNTVAMVGPLSGVALSSFDASGGNVFFGPDSLAFDPTAGELYLFSAFGDLSGGVTDPSGTAVRSFGLLPAKYAGAGFNASGDLWVAERPNLMSDNDNLLRLDTTTGSVLETVVVSGASFNPNLSGLVFDPISGNPFAYDTDQQVLLEIDLSSGLVLSETAVGSFFSEFDVAGGIAFNATGSKLFLGSGVSISHPTGIVSELVVLDRFDASTVPLPAGVWLLIPACTVLMRRRTKNTSTTL